jgi:competence ComEA-like helix-hairpin-helix protein
MLRTRFVRGLSLVVLVLALRSGVAAAEPARLEGVVNINTASADELELLPGVGPARARLIVEYRDKHPFRTVEELARIKGIGPGPCGGCAPTWWSAGPPPPSPGKVRGRRAPAVPTPPA